MKKILLLLVLLSLLILPSVFAKQGHMKLLAVKENGDGSYEGGTADLYLEIKEGSGRVFLETFPLTKTDTQMSTRFAKAIACDFLDNGCDDYDFFYTITADTAIIAGPSAGAALATLTVALIDDLPLNEDYAITGTINSGGLIGPVGGLKAKVEAAKKANLKKVFIPAGELIVKVDNKTIDLQNLSKELGIEIIPVSELSEAIKEFTGKEIRENYKNIDVSEQYTSTMRSLANQLCDRSNKLKADALSADYSVNVSLIKDNAKNLTARGKEAFEKQTFYSSASYCFGANVEYSTILLLSKNLSKDEMIKEAENLKEEIKEFRDDVESREKNTITDLEAYIVVKERLAEADESSNNALETLNSTNSTQRAIRDIAYSSERINSAYAWATFLGKEGKTFNLNNDVLKKSCQAKISEVDERIQYVELYVPTPLDSIKNSIENANKELESKNYELCLSIASKAKADVDVILSVFGVDNDQYNNILERKLEIVKNNIARQAAKGIFPILGYSYYEYANSLKNNDVLSALLYSEYALELGNLDIYFKESSPSKDSISIGNGVNVNKKLLGIFVLGAAIGFAAGSFARIRIAKIKAKKRKK